MCTQCHACCIVPSSSSAPHAMLYTSFTRPHRQPHSPVPILLLVSLSVYRVLHGFRGSYLPHTSRTLQSHLCKSHRCCKSSNISTFTTVYCTTHPKTIKLISLQSTLRARSSQSHSRSNTALQSPRNAARFISANISLHLGTVDTR